MQRVVVVAVLGLLAAPAGARADVALEELGRLTPVAGYAGWHAWSACQGFAAVPCRLVGSLVSPFSGVLPAAGEDPWYTAVAATGAVATWAGRGTVGSVQP